MPFIDQSEWNHGDELARLGDLAAAAEYERIGDARRERGDALGALIAYRAAIEFGSTHGLDAITKRRIEDKQNVTGVFWDVNSVLAGAARTLGTHPAHTPGHRALCAGCGAIKPAAWLICSECQTPPNGSRALGLLLSERVRSPSELEALSSAMLAGADPGVPIELTRAVESLLTSVPGAIDSLLRPLRPGAADDERPIGVRTPGTIAAQVDETGKRAVLLAVGTTSDIGASKPDFWALADSAALALLSTAGDAHPDELIDAQGVSIRDRRRALEKRIGERIAFERWERMELPDAGCIGASTIGYVVRAPARPPMRNRHALFSGNLVAALIALETGTEIADRGALRQFADALASHFAGGVCTGYRHAVRNDDPITGPYQSLGNRAFEAAPYLTVEQAINVMSGIIGCGLKVRSIRCWERPRIDSDGPDVFPGEAAKRA